MKKEFAQTLKDLRLKAGYTQKQVYEMLNIPQSTFSSWEIGKAEPSASMTLKLCELYHVDNILEAFGYNGYNSDGNLQLNMKEIELVEKYRALNENGKDMLNTILRKNYFVDTQSDNSARLRLLPDTDDHLTVQAAHDRTDIEVTDEMRKHDSNIMSDDSFWNS